MAKKSQLDKAIDSIDAEILVLIKSRDRLIAQRPDKTKLPAADVAAS